MTTKDQLAAAWSEGYKSGISDERTSEANIGIAGFNAKVDPARNNPYLVTPIVQQPAEQAQPEPTPQWCEQCGEGVTDFCRAKVEVKCGYGFSAAKQARPERAPLSDEAADRILRTVGILANFETVREIIHATEAAHNITVKVKP